MPLLNLIQRLKTILSGRFAARTEHSGAPEVRRRTMRRAVVWLRASVVCAGLLGLSGVPAGAQTTAATVTVGPNPSSIAVNPVTNKIYVGNRKVRTVNNEQFCDVTSVVTVINGATDVTTSVQAGYCPRLQLPRTR